MTDETAKARALADWPISVHPRLGLGPTTEDICRWYFKHGETIRAALSVSNDKPVAWQVWLEKDLWGASFPKKEDAIRYSNGQPRPLYATPVKQADAPCVDVETIKLQAGNAVKIPGTATLRDMNIIHATIDYLASRNMIRTSKGAGE